MAIPVGLKIAILEGVMPNRMSGHNDTGTLRSGFLADTSQPPDQYDSRRNDQMRGAPVRTEIKIEIDRWENEGGRVVTAAAAGVAG
jgi:hypothetical protein